MTDLTVAIDLDVAYDGMTLEAALFDMTEDLDTITCRVVTPAGPGGGWPIIRFRGNPVEVMELVMRYTDGDQDMAAELFRAA